MKKTTQHSSPLAATIHETAERLYAGGLMNNLTMSGNVFADIGFTRLPKHQGAQRAEQCAARHGKQAPPVGIHVQFSRADIGGRHIVFLVWASKPRKRSSVIVSGNSH